MTPGVIRTIRGDRMLERFTLRGHPVTFSGIEVAIALWTACWLPGYYAGLENFQRSFGLLAEATGGLLSPALLAWTFGAIGIAHVAIMGAAWVGLARPPRYARITFNFAQAILFGFISGVGIHLEAWTATGPYVLLTIFVVQNMARAVRNGRGYSALP